MRNAQRRRLPRNRRTGRYIYPGAPALPVRGRVGQKELDDHHGEAADQNSPAAASGLYAGGHYALQALADVCAVLARSRGGETEARRCGEDDGHLRKCWLGLPPPAVLADYDVIEEYALAAMDNLQSIIDALALAKQAAEEARQEIRM